MQIGHFDTFFNGPTMTEWHGGKYRCLSTSLLHMTFCSCCNLWATWELSAAWCHQSVSLLCSEPTECYEMRSAEISNLQLKLVTMCFSHVLTLKENPHDGWWCRQDCNTVQEAAAQGLLYRLVHQDSSCLNGCSDFPNCCDSFTWEHPWMGSNCTSFVFLSFFHRLFLSPWHAKY